MPIELLGVDAVTWVVIAGMALATFLTRIGGVAVLSRIPITPRFEAFLRYLASCVLVALVAPAIVQGGPRFAIAAGAVLAVLALTRSTMLAVVAGVAAAALQHALLATG